MGENPKWMEDVAKAGGWEEHHLANLEKQMELRKQEVALMKEITKIQPETWNQIKDTMKNLNEIIQGGGLGSIETGILTTFKDSILDNIAASISDALSPLTNEINQAMGELLTPINDALGTISNNLSQFIAGNSVGAGWGGVIGGALGTFWGGPLGRQAGEMIGAIVGAQVQDWIEDAFGPPPSTATPGREQFNPFGPFANLVGWLYILFTHEVPPWMLSDSELPDDTRGRNPRERWEADRGGR